MSARTVYRSVFFCQRVFMRVLFITGEFPPMQGGVGDCTNEIALALANRGVQVSVLTTGDSEATAGQPTTKDTTLSLDVRRVVKKWDWSALSRIQKTIADTRADIYHIQYQTGAFGMHPMINFAPRLFRLFSTAAQARSVVTFHDLRPMYLFPKAGHVRDWVTFQLARSCDAVVATNEQDYVQLAACRLRHLALIPIGSNIHSSPPPDFDRDALRARLALEPAEILLCYFGFLNDSKGGETLIRALAEIPNAKLLMLGAQTGASDPTNLAYLAQVKKSIDDQGLTRRVIWTDFLAEPQVSAHFLASDICVLPYRDGVSYRRGTFMAALAHGMTIVTTDAGRRTSAPTDGRLPALCDGENVVLVPPDNVTELAAAVKRIAASPTLKAKLQNGARETAQFFTWDKIADAHLELYETLMRA